jgi:hypothetical protein
MPLPRNTIIRKCGTCRYFRETGYEDSGIGDWKYRIGECRNTTKYLGTYSGSDKKDIPEFVSFYCWKRKR